jgi:hypothetical protein
LCCGAERQQQHGVPGSCVITDHEPVLCLLVFTGVAALLSIFSLQESGAKHYMLKKNPLKNLGAMIKLNPQAASARR